MIFKAPRSELFKFKIHLLSSKNPKNPGIQPRHGYLVYRSYNKIIRASISKFVLDFCWLMRFFRGWNRIVGPDIISSKQLVAQKLFWHLKVRFDDLRLWNGAIFNYVSRHLTRFFRVFPLLWMKSRPIRIKPNWNVLRKRTTEWLWLWICRIFMPHPWGILYAWSNEFTFQNLNVEWFSWMPWFQNDPNFSFKYHYWQKMKLSKGKR